MPYDLNDIKLFAYLIKSNDLSMDVARSWCFDQYALDEVPVWVEEITIETSKDELLELLKKHYGVDGSIDTAFEIGSYCQWYQNGGFSLYALIQNLLVYMGKDTFSAKDLAMLEKGEALFQSDKDAVQDVLPMMQGFIDNNGALYKERLEQFMRNMDIDLLK